MTTVFDLLGELETYEGEEASLIQRLKQAQAALRFSIGVAEEVARQTGNRTATAYLIDPLKVHASGDHEFLSGDFNFDQWINELENPSDEE